MALLQGLGGIIGGYMGRDAVKQGNRAYMEALEKMKQATADQNILDAGDYVSDYEMADPDALSYYTPEQEMAEQQAASELNNVSLDPAYQEAQRTALQRLNQRADEGLTVSEEAARNQIMGAMNTANRGNQEAVMQSMARRGMSGSGSELAAALAGGQNAYVNAADEAQNLAAQRDSRALEAALQGGNLATSLRTQDYGEQASLAKAQDAINAFNTNQRADVNTRNIGNTNTAAQQAAALKNQAYYNNLGLTNKNADQRTTGTLSSNDARNQKAMDIANAALGIGKTKQAQAVEAGAFRAGMAEGIGKFGDDAVKAVASMGTSEMMPSSGGGIKGGAGSTNSAPNLGNYGDQLGALYGK